MKNREKFDLLNLRVKKAAKTKLMILEVFLELLKEKTLEQIKVEEICKRVEISHKTFFNYFEKKEQLVSYFIQLHSYEMGYLSQKLLNKTAQPLEAIREIFRNTARGIEGSPQIMIELICLQTTASISCSFEISTAEKLYYYPDIEDIETYSEGGFNTLIPSLLREAIILGELHHKTDVDFLYLEIMSMFYGSSIFILKLEPKKYAQKLDTMIVGLLDKHKTGEENDR